MSEAATAKKPAARKPAARAKSARGAGRATLASRQADTAAVKSGGTASAASRTRVATSASSSKYSQTGAPWWKAHL